MRVNGSVWGSPFIEVLSCMIKTAYIGFSSMAATILIELREPVHDRRADKALEM